MLFKFNNRDKVKDQITGMVGVIICRSEWINGCIRYSVQPLALKDGLPADNLAFDEDQLDLVEEPAKEQAPDKPRTGGPRNDPKRGQDVRF